MAELITVREILAESYANLAMAHMGVTNGSVKYGVPYYMVRAKLRKGLLTGTMSMRPLIADEKLKMVLPQACSYCGSKERLSGDHLIPTKQGGPNKGENLVWACRRCNSSKGAKDMLVWWFSKHESFPPLLLLRRYLKIAWQLADEADLLDETASDASLPISFETIPIKYPRPPDLLMWVIPLPT